jgi:hypothetical protein
MKIGDPIEICRPVIRRGRLEQQWFPATVELVDDLSVRAVFADHSRRDEPLNPYAIRPQRREEAA